MALPNTDPFFSVTDCKIAKLLTDPAGGSATYAPYIDVPIDSVSTSLQQFKAELRADGKRRDNYTENDVVTGSFTISELAMDVLATVLGVTLSTTGTGSTEKKSLTIKATDTIPYFLLAFKAPYSPESSVADKHACVYKCKITGVEFGGGDRQYTKPVVNFEALPRLSDDKLAAYVFLGAVTAPSAAVYG